MSLINITNLTFAYESSYDNIFENVSFQLDTDWKLGFTGRNGRGKTTFLKLLAGQHEYTGIITASVSFDYFPFEVPDKTIDSIEVIASLYPDYEAWKLFRELSLLQVKEEVLYGPFDTLSNGEQTKLLLAALFMKENHFLLIDEPTNHLDMEARQNVSDYLNQKSGFILVSHDRYFLDGCIDHILSINKTNIEVQRGNFSTWWQNKSYRDNYELAENERLAREVKKLSEAARRTSGWSDAVERTKIGEHAADRGAIGHKAEKMMKRSKAVEQRRQRALTEKTRLKNLEKTETVSVRPLQHHTRKLAEISELSIRYGENKVCGGISFTVTQGERIALCGKNGSGKSSILKLLLGEPLHYEGIVRLASGLIVSYVPQDPSFLKGGLREYANSCGIDESLFMTILRKFDFPRIQFEKDLSSLSAGQRKKVLIARSLCEEAHLYIWDEPLNYIDVLSRMQIENLILDYKPTMVFVEHDRYFLENTATRRIEL